jgi:hypothetical protein
MRKLKDPSSVLIEVTAGSICAQWYEIGRSQGLKSKSKTVKEYVNANVEKFIPRAIDHLLDILHNPFTPEDQKILIYDALSERVNDPNNITSTDIRGLQPLDVMKVLSLSSVAPPSQQLKKVREKPTVINTSVGMGVKEIAKRLKTGSAIGKVNG